MPRSSLLAALVALIAFAGVAATASAERRTAVDQRLVGLSYRVAASAKLDGPTLVVRVTLRHEGASRTLAGAAVRVARRTKITNRSGIARFTLPASPRKAFTVTVTKDKLRGLKLRVHPRVVTG
jgi:hypothetical protein